MLNMEDFANAVVGVPGEGLNVEQRKLLTIGVELAAKPKLLLFLDEPTSGLDSQSSWAICAFLRKLANSGQAILCTVHQPSAILFQEFDRLLFLAKGGKTVYFGEIGENSRTLLNYFESHGARKCDDMENPAEYMLEIVNKGSNDNGQDWHSVWKSSSEREGVDAEVDRIHSEKLSEAPQDSEDKHAHSEFAMPFTTQLFVVTQRVFQQYWRLPSYIMAKFMLGIAAGLFIGFTFYDADNTQAGMQIVIFSVFMLTTLFSTLVQQVSGVFFMRVEVSWLTLHPDPTPIHHSAVPVRSPRASQQGLLLESVHDCQHLRRDSIPDHHWYFDLRLFLLSRRWHPKLRTTSPRPAVHHSAVHLHQCLCPDDHCCTSRCTNCGRNRHNSDDDEHHLQRCSPDT